VNLYQDVARSGDLAVIEQEAAAAARSDELQVRLASGMLQT